MEVSSIYCCGYNVNDQFHPLPTNCSLGYWYNDSFIPADDWDGSQDSTIPVVLWTQKLGWKQLPVGAYAVFYYRNQYFPSLTTAEEEKLRVEGPLFCVLCRHQKPRFRRILGKDCCADCILERYLGGKLYFDTTSHGEEVEWSALIIFKIHTKLMSVLSEENKRKMPSEIKLPREGFVCVGKKETVRENYPSYGHIAYEANRCLRDGCPNTDHALCKTCANRLTQCPLCSSHIEYEVIPEDNVPGCICHVPTFDAPCANCGKRYTRTKKRP